MRHSDQFMVNYSLAKAAWDAAKSLHKHGRQFGEFAPIDDLAVLYFQNNRAFFGITNEQELVNFFAPQQGVLYLQQAIKMGARHLSCFAPLVPFYADNGFGTYRIVPFDPELVPAEWEGPKHSTFYMQYGYGE